VRIVSLHPAATEIVFALGLGEELVGVTAYCDAPREARGVAVVARYPTTPDASAPPGPALLELDRDALDEADPDLVILSDSCRVCTVGAREVRAIADEIDEEVEVLSLDPVSVEGVFNAIQTVGAMTEAEDAAMDAVVGLRERLRAIEAIVVARRDHGFAAPRIAALEWLDPPMAAGRWIPEQVRLAGGWELLGHERAMPSATSWAALREVDPEIIVLMPAGLDLPATVAAWDALPRPDGWSDLHAVREGRVFAVDGAAYFWRPGPRIVDGIEVLAEIVDPKAFDGLAPNDSFVRVG
jgi:iron complex transport system substrate-binding protein